MSANCRQLCVMIMICCCGWTFIFFVIKMSSFLEVFGEYHLSGSKRGWNNISNYGSYDLKSRKS